MNKNRDDSSAQPPQSDGAEQDTYQQPGTDAPLEQTYTSKKPEHGKIYYLFHPGQRVLTQEQLDRKKERDDYKALIQQRKNDRMHTTTNSWGKAAVRDYFIIGACAAVVLYGIDKIVTNTITLNNDKRVEQYQAQHVADSTKYATTLDSLTKSAHGNYNTVCTNLADAKTNLAYLVSEDSKLQGTVKDQKACIKTLTPAPLGNGSGKKNKPAPAAVAPKVEKPVAPVAPVVEQPKVEEPKVVEQPKKTDDDEIGKVNKKFDDLQAKRPKIEE